MNQDNMMVTKNIYHFAPKLALGVLGVIAVYITTNFWCSQSVLRSTQAKSFISSSSNLFQNKFISGSSGVSGRVGRYPLSDPVTYPGGIKYKLGIISDLDKDRSKVPGKPFHWRSYYKTGYLVHDSGGYRFELTQTFNVTSTLNEKGRGLELSELCVFNEKLYAADDRTGVIFHLVDNHLPIPWVILQDGDGSEQKGFKCEWMTVKDNLMYVGSMGKERTTSGGAFENLNPMFVKTISPTGEVQHLNWTSNYRTLRRKVGIEFPGYILHEAAMWSERKRKWFFLPRRMSKLKYDDVADEMRNANILLSSSEDFTSVDVVYIGDTDISHGFSSFKFIPGTNDNFIVALRTKEVGDEVKSYMLVIDVNSGKVLMHEQFIDDQKYEGVEFL